MWPVTAEQFEMVQYFSLLSRLSFVPMEFTTEYKEYFYHYHTCSIAEISHLVATEIPPDQLPLAYLNILSADDMTVCLQATMICWMMSKKTMVPRKMQLRVVLADAHAKDALASANPDFRYVTLGASGNFKICLNLLIFYLPHLFPNKWNKFEIKQKTLLDSTFLLLISLKLT